jgi:hypothetical protein
MLPKHQNSEKKLTHAIKKVFFELDWHANIVGISLRINFNLQRTGCT